MNGGGPHLLINAIGTGLFLTSWCVVLPLCVAAGAQARSRMAADDDLRIVSFLPAATEMIYELGLGDKLVGVSHECDYPPDAKNKPVIVDVAIDMSNFTMAEIDVAVSERIGSGKSLYVVDAEKLNKANPTLLVTQSLCQVCGPAGNEVTQVLKAMKPGPEILWQTPKTYEEVLGAMEELGRRTGKHAEAVAWVEAARKRVADLRAKTASLPKVKVSFLEWIDPIYCGGHWTAEMMGWAGGHDANARHAQDSVRTPWEKVLEFQPDVVVVAPCGFRLNKAYEQAKQLMQRPGFTDLPAYKAGRVFAVDANSYFARPGPRVVDGVHLLACMFHPEHFTWDGPEDAFARVTEEVAQEQKEMPQEQQPLELPQ